MANIRIWFKPQCSKTYFYWPWPHSEAGTVRRQTNHSSPQCGALSLKLRQHQSSPMGGGRVSQGDNARVPETWNWSQGFPPRWQPSHEWRRSSGPRDNFQLTWNKNAWQRAVNYVNKSNASYSDIISICLTCRWKCICYFSVKYVCLNLYNFISQSPQ